MLGGWLTETYSWRWVFYINVPVGIASILMTRAFIFDPPYIKGKRSGGIDFWGIGLLALWVGALQIVLDKGQEDDWFSSHFIQLLIAIAILGSIAWVAREYMAGHPVVDLRVLKNRTFSTGTALMSIVGFVLYGSMVLLPVWLTLLLGYPHHRRGWPFSVPHMAFHINWPLPSLKVENKTAAPRINLFPNPANDQLDISFILNSNANVKISVINTIGQVVAVHNIGNVSNGKAVFNTSGFPAGVYLYTLDADGARSTGRFVIAH